MKMFEHFHALGYASLLAGAISAHAYAPVYNTFDITWSFGALNGTISSGSFTYDSMLLTGIGQEYLGSDSGFMDFSLDLDGNVFSLNDDLEFGLPSSPRYLPANPALPVLIFNDGVFSGFDYIAVIGGETLQISLLSAEFGNGVNDSEGFITGFSSVPEFSTAVLLVAGIGAIALARRKL